MREIAQQLARWAAEGERAAVATVVGVRRSAPRPPGGKLAVSSRGEIVGAVSGGCVEGAVVSVAERVLGGAPAQLLHFGIEDADAWDIGLPCGGEIDVWVQEHNHGRFAELALSGGRAVEVTLLSGDPGGAKLVIEPGGKRHGTLHGGSELDQWAAELAAELLWSERSQRFGDLFFDVLAPDPRLIVFGAVDVAGALCRLARGAGWLPYVVDPRPRFASAARFPDAEAVIVGWPEEAFTQLGGIDPATSVVVLTHDPKLDDAALSIALRSPARFVGAMGSRRAQAARRERLRTAGLEQAEIDRMSAPLGLDLGAVSAEETALSILSEVVAARHGHGGGRLSDGAGRIHEVPA